MAVDWDGLVLGPCIAIFGEPVTHQSGTDNIVRSVTGIFDDSFERVDPLAMDGMEPSFISTTKACLGIRLIDFPVAPQQHDLIVARGVTYRVLDVRPDGKDGAKLVLNLA